MIALLAIGLGLALGMASGGRLYRLSTISIRFELAILVLFVAQGVARGRLLNLTGRAGWSLAVWEVVSLVLAILLFVNWRVPGQAIASLGVLINAVVVLANMGMPVVGGGAGGLDVTALSDAVKASAGFYLRGNVSTLGLGWADVIPLRLGTQSLLLSVGDVLLVVGVVATVVWAMTAHEVAASSPDGVSPT